MIVYILETAPENLRGELCRWLLEVKAGVFIGNISKPVRDRLWEKICQSETKGALMVHSTNTEQGYHFEMFGEPYRSVVQMNGVELIQIIKE